MAIVVLAALSRASLLNAHARVLIAEGSTLIILTLSMWSPTVAGVGWNSIDDRAAAWLVVLSGLITLHTAYGILLFGFEIQILISVSKMPRSSRPSDSDETYLSGDPSTWTAMAGDRLSVLTKTRLATWNGAEVAVRGRPALTLIEAMLAVRSVLFGIHS